MIPYGYHDITQDDIKAVVSVLKSDFLTQGPMVPKFEKIVANKMKAKYALAVNSATSALHIACLALGVKETDYLWTSPITFVASANCARYCGANINFVDIDKHTYNIDPYKLEKKLIYATQCKNLPKVVIVVHFGGQSCNMQLIWLLSLKYKFLIIEDASHAIGGSYKGELIGSCRYSHITIFSFHPVKIITTAEGGMALTNDPLLASAMDLFRNHGITRNVEQMTYLSDEPWYYQQLTLGFNYRMTELQAALGISQFSRLEGYIERRHKLARRYNKLLDKLPIIKPWQSINSYSAFHLYVIRLKLNQINLTHLQVFKKLREAGINVNLHYIPLHLQPYYQKFGFKVGDYPEAEKYYTEAISLPMFTKLTYIQQDYIVSILKRILIQ